MIRDVHAEREQRAPPGHRSVDRTDQRAVLTVVLGELGARQCAREQPDRSTQDTARSEECGIRLLSREGPVAWISNRGRPIQGRKRFAGQALGMEGASRGTGEDEKSQEAPHGRVSAWVSPTPREGNDRP
jgi:hypothetical protein